ncbi:MAG: trypsin-like peptidase domain-containing protein [Oceanospirillaceae bacterium]|nr:trypsin-like peptidase domain-containing protein [Oceanospirillaceae bacterium]
MKKFAFLAWPALCGILIALLILQFRSQIITPVPTTITRVDITQIRSAPVANEVQIDKNFIRSYADAVDKAAPAVVNIYIRTESVDDNSNTPLPAPSSEFNSSLGSGVILNQQGYIVTNNHVIDKADEIVVALQDGREALAKVIGTDPGTDLAILKINLTQLPVIMIEESDSLRVGDVVLAIGNPFDFGQTVTKGIISAKSRTSVGLNRYENFLQTDAAINPGNSGGALINTQGNLVGISTAIFSKSGGSNGIGFAIPSSLALKIMRNLIEDGRVIRGWLGVETQELTPQLAESFGLNNVRGLILAGVITNGPAYNAGLQVGDLILAFNDVSIISGLASMRSIAEVKPGSIVKVNFLRNGESLTTNILVGERPST